MNPVPILVSKRSPASFSRTGHPLSHRLEVEELGTTLAEPHWLNRGHLDLHEFEGKAPSPIPGDQTLTWWLVGSAARIHGPNVRCQCGGKWTVRNLPATALAVLYLGTDDNRYTAGMGKWWAWIFVRGWSSSGSNILRLADL
jgi:hypothetical protein